MTSSAFDAGPERALILTYAAPGRRGALAALLSLDDALATLLRTTREPAIGQIRLAWWRERLAALVTGPVPAEPVLTALAQTGIRGKGLEAMVDGWEVLLEERLDEEALGRFATGRGMLFVNAGIALGAKGTDPTAMAGFGWALGDLARHLGDEAEAAQARALAEPLLRSVTRMRWSPQARALGALAHLALRDLKLAPGEAPPVGSPARVARLAWHRLTGR
jgi:phytoene synthase